LERIQKKSDWAVTIIITTKDPATKETTVIMDVNNNTNTKNNNNNNNNTSISKDKEQAEKCERKGALVPI
jgi:hypothetical protein